MLNRTIVFLFFASASGLSRRGSEVSGVATITTSADKTLKVVYDCAGLEPNVERGGIHVHQGSSCNNIGEFYSEDGEPSPFTAVSVSYHSDARGVAQGSFLVNGISLSPLTGHVFVMHLVIYNDVVFTNGSCSPSDFIDNITSESAQDCKNRCGAWERSRGCGAAYFNPRLRLCEVYKKGGCDFPSGSGVPNGQIFTTKNISYSCAPLVGNDSELVATFVVKRYSVSSTTQVKFGNPIDDVTTQVVQAALCQLIGDLLNADPISCSMTKTDENMYEFNYLGAILNNTVPSTSNWSDAMVKQLRNLAPFDETWEDPTPKNFSNVSVVSTLVMGLEVTAPPFASDGPYASSSKSNVGLIVGVAIGALALLCIIIVCLLCCISRRRKQREVLNASSFAASPFASSPLASSSPGEENAVMLHTANPPSYVVNERSPLKQEIVSLDHAPHEEPMFSLPATFYNPVSGTPLNDERVFKTSRNSYKASKILGRGKFGIAYLVTDEQGRVHVLKTLHCMDNEARNEALKEAKALGQAPDSVHLLKQKDYWFDGDEFCIVVNYCSGGSLDEQVSLHLEPMEVERILKELCQGLSILHGAGLVHRDLKPDNVFLSDPVKRTVVIGDMGLARPVEDDGFYSSKFGHLLYKAPEITAGKYSRSSDMWSVGCIGLELLSGETLAMFHQESHVVLGLCEEQKRDRILTAALGAHSHTAAYGIIRGLLLSAPENRLTAQGVINFRVVPQSSYHSNDDYQ